MKRREQRPVLNVIVGPPGTPFVEKTETATIAGRGCIGPTTLTGTLMGMRHAWSWRAGKGPSIPSIELGLTTELELGRPAAIFRWESKRGRYVGPEGNAVLGFVQIPADNPDETIARFVESFAEQ